MCLCVLLKMFFSVFTFIIKVFIHIRFYQVLHLRRQMALQR